MRYLRPVIILIAIAAAVFWWVGRSSTPPGTASETASAMSITAGDNASLEAPKPSMPIDESKRDLYLQVPEIDFAKVCIAEKRLQPDRDWTKWDGGPTNLSDHATLKLAQLYYNGSLETPMHRPTAAKLFKLLVDTPSKTQAKAKYFLARLHITGEGVTQDMEKALALLEETKTSYAYGSAFVLAEHYKDLKNYSKAAELYRISANAGNIKSAVLLAHLYDQKLAPAPSEKAAHDVMALAQNMALETIGKGVCSGLHHIALSYLTEKVVAQNEPLAAKWLEASSDAGIAQSKLVLAELYRKGLGVHEDVKRSFTLWKEAAESGSTLGMYRYGMAYLLGNGVEKNREQAIIWLEKSALRSNIVGISTLIKIYHGAYGDQVDYPKATRWLKLAEQHREASPEQLFLLAKAYDYGLGTEQDTEAAFAMYTRAAKQGNPSAIYKLGQAYLRGIGVESTPIKSLKFFRLAASHGSKDAMLAMYKNYTCDAGIPASKETASRWLNRALAHNSISATLNIINTLEKEGTAESLTKRLKLLRKLAKADPKSQVILGATYWDGIGVKKDEEMAEYWFNRAIAPHEKQAAGMVQLARLYFRHPDLNDPSKAIELLEKAANNNHNSAMYELGKLYTGNQYGIPINLTKAFSFLQKAAEQGHQDSMLELAEQYIDTGHPAGIYNPDKALQWFNKAAQSGSFNAMMRLATVYHYGTGVLQDVQQSATWIERAIQAQPCSLTERLSLSRAYALGIGVPQDDDIAKRWFDKARGGITDTAKDMTKIADAYLHGYGIAPNLDEASAWYQKAADLDSLPAMRQLGRFYLKGVADKGRQPKLAIDWFEKAAKMGDIASMLELGKIYAAGYYIPRDRSKAEALLKQASSAGSTQAHFELGNLYTDLVSPLFNLDQAILHYLTSAEEGDVSSMLALLNLFATHPEREKPQGRTAELIKLAIEVEHHTPRDMANIAYAYEQGVGVEKDLNKAFYWTERAADAGEPKAMRQLGRFYMHGRIVAKDVTLAFNWLNQALKFGDTPSMVELGRAYSLGTDTEKDLEKAFYYFELAAQNGSSHAMREVGYLYLHGQGVSMDPVQGINWFKKSADLGDDKAMVELANAYNAGFGVEQSPELAKEWLEKAANAGNDQARMQIILQDDSKGAASFSTPQQ